MTAHRDTVLRMALVSMAADAHSSLTAGQRQWVVDLAQRSEALTPYERQRLKTPLLAWVKEHWPRSLDTISAQFAEE